MKLRIDKKFTPVFCPKPAGKTKVLRKNIFGKYREMNVNIVEIDVYKKSGMHLLKRLNNKWGKEKEEINNLMNYYLGKITGNAEDKRNLPNVNVSDMRIYAMTKQRFCLKFLNPKKILGVAQIHTDSANLAYPQVRPKYQFAGNPKRQIKHIGKQFLECLKRIIKKDSIRIY